MCGLHQCLSLVPKESWDDALKTTFTCLAYQVNKPTQLPPVTFTCYVTKFENQKRTVLTWLRSNVAYRWSEILCASASKTLAAVNESTEKAGGGVVLASEGVAVRLVHHAVH